MTQPTADTERLTSDHSLLRRVRTGESDAATDLYYRYADRLRALAGSQIGDRLASRIEPDDVVQSVFRTFFRRVLAEDRYDVPAGDEIWGLFLVIALNKVRAKAVHYAAAKRDVSRTSQLQEHHLEIPAQDSREMMLREVIVETLKRLPALHHQVVTLRVEGHSTREIAQSVSRSRRTVERILQGFRESLAARIESEV